MPQDLTHTAARDDDASKDEFDLALQEGVEDDTLLENPGVRKFTINSYGADYTVDSLVKRMRTGAFKIPEFQRRFVWTVKHSSKFIESLLMGLPVPGIFLYKEAGTNEHLVIDGQQRLRTLRAFYDGIFGDKKDDKKFRLIGVREPWLGRSYEELEPADILKLDDSIVHATIFQQDQPQDVLDSIYFVFERINSGGIRLSPQEIRNCINPGPFTHMVHELNENPTWRQVFGPMNSRARDEELIVRFFALYVDGMRYMAPMNAFLNNFSHRENKVPQQELDQLKLVFTQTIALVDKTIGVRAFRLSRSLNAAVFDSVMVALARRLSTGKSIDPSKVAPAHEKLLGDPAYRQACERATADEENVRTRQTLALQAFAKI